LRCVRICGALTVLGTFRIVGATAHQATRPLRRLIVITVNQQLCRRLLLDRLPYNQQIITNVLGVCRRA
jgi:hypothetical protein